MSDESENDSEISENAGEINEHENAIKEKETFKINNVSALNSKLKLIQLNLDWVEKLDIAVNTEENDTLPDDTTDDSKAENDFKREMSFYNQALKAVSKAFKRLHKLGIPTRRPADFYAEMAKSDAHMNKVREKLLSKQTAIERRDKVRAIREQKKHGKKIQKEILQERKAEKKKMLNALKKTKKGKMNADALLAPVGSKKDIPTGSKKDTPLKFKRDNPQGWKKDGFKSDKNKKFREKRDMKYGYGGKKRGSKWNTAESSASAHKQNSGPRFSKDKKFGRNKPRPKTHRRRR